MASSSTAEIPARLAVCFDGTWNSYDQQTNVARLYASIADAQSGCGDQIKFYDEGVGTAPGERLRGGVGGYGLDDNILQGYCWLINNYAPGPPMTADNQGEVFLDGAKLFIFGFSRGAYTARSLGGLVNRCGILRRDRLGDRRATTEHPLVREAWSLYRRRFTNEEGEGRLHPAARKFRTDNSHTVLIELLGVWDTVGALGIPASRWKDRWTSADKYGFHDTSLGRIVRHAFHAIAVDENREDYNVTLWTKKYDPEQEVEQRWFPGAHANVGGGYEDDLLPSIALFWMAKMAAARGLEFSLASADVELEAKACEAAPRRFVLDGTEYLAPIRDSYREFMWGIYAAYKWVTDGPLFGRPSGRFYRRMLVDGVNERIDLTVEQKYRADPGYRPVNYSHAGREDLDRAAANVISNTL